MQFKIFLVGKGGVDMLDFGGWKLRVEVFFEVPFWFLWGRFFACVFANAPTDLSGKMDEYQLPIYETLICLKHLPLLNQRCSMPTI